MLLAALLQGSSPKDVGPDKIDVSAYPQPMREAYELFAIRCSKCHSLARPINSHLQGEEWKRYIKKMIRRPGSGINEEDGRTIYEFLKFQTTRPAPAESPDGGMGPQTAPTR